MIIVPPFSWFREGNGYTGSSGTNPEKGSLCVKTFHFRLDVVRDENSGERHLVATDYTENPWPDGRDPDSEHSFQTSFDEDGLEQAKQWLSSEEMAALQQA